MNPSPFAFALALASSGLFLATPTLAQSDAAKLGPWSEAAEEAWWNSHASPEDWVTEKNRMTPTLRSAHQRHGLRSMVENQHWLAWMLHARWLSLFPDDWASHPSFGQGPIQETFASLARQPKIRALLLSSLVPEDDATEATSILCRIAHRHPEDFASYPTLAVAFALVFDNPIPKTWPHSFVDPAKVATGDPDPADRFKFLVECHKQERLIHDISKLSVRDLMFVVDTPLEHRELTYAQRIDLRTPNRLSQLYPAVKYDMSRIRSETYKWPGETYRLVDIGKQGGICMDQAFFVAQSGKAQGVPTIFFVGQGLSGEHAWVGFLGGNRRWELDVARYRGQEYPIGQALDPQTWQRISDTELEALTSGLSSLSRSSMARGQKLLQWAALNQGNELYAEILESARRELREDPRPWKLEADWLEESEAPAKKRAAFWQEWSRNFEKNPDLQVQGQMRQIALLEEMGREDQAEKLRREVISKHKSKRFDLGISIAAEPVFRHLEKQRYEEARDAFESAMRRFRSKAGGHLYYHLLQPYVLTCLQEGQVDSARDALKHLERGFEVIPGSILDNDRRALATRVNQAL